MKILYVEDDPRDVELTQRQFDQTAPEWQLTAATTIIEARQQVEQEDYHVVLIDLSLPDGRGLDFLAELCANKPETAAIVISGSEETAVAALKIGARDYVIKSGDYLERLPTLVQKSYGRHLQEQSRRKSRLKVLYVEHDAADIELTQRHLARHAPHIQIEFVHSVAELLSRLPETADKNAPYPYDVLLIDYKLPGLNALDALKIIRHERDLTIPIILATGQGSEEIAVQTIRLGATNYLVKHSGYLAELPGALENAHYYAKLQREQAALRESEARFRRLVENAQDIIYRINLIPEQRFEFVSPSVLAMTGYTPDDYYNDPQLGYKIVHPDDKHLLESALKNPASISEPLSLRWARKDGRVIWVEQRNIPIFNEQGQMVAVEGVARDMTEQQNLLAALRQREQQFATLCQNADDLIARFDRELRHLYVNPAIEKLAGIPLADYVGKTNAELGMPADLVAFWDREMRHVVATAVPNAISFQFTGADKRPRYFEAQITPEFDDEGQVVSLLSIVRDITNQVAAQEKLQTQGAALNAAANGIAITDVHGTIEWVNPAFTTLTGYTLEEAVGKNPRDLVKSGVHTNLLYRNLWETILSGVVWQGEMVNRRKDGRLYSEEQTITPVFDKAGKITHFIAIKQDISERKASEESLRRSEERFRALIERGNDAILLLDPDGLIVYQSPNTERLISGPVGQLVGQNIFDLIGDEDLPRMTRLFTKVLLKPNEPLDTEISLWQGDGSLRWFEVALNNLLDFPAVQAIVVNYRDITDRKQGREATERAQKLAQATIDALDANIAVLDENGVIQAVNRSWLAFAQDNGGRLAQVGEGVNYLEVCDRTTGPDQEMAAQMAAGIRAVIAGKGSFDLEYPCHPPHQRRWFTVRVTPLPTDDLNLRWVAVAHEDVTTRKLAEEAVKRSERHYRLLFDSNPQAMWVYDLKTLAFLAVNNAAVHKYGYSRPQFLSMTLKDIRPTEEIPKLLDDLARPRPVLQHSSEWRHRLRDGRIIDVEIRSHQLRFDGRDAALVVAFDITERKQAQIEREAQAGRLQQIIDALPGGIVMVDNQGQIKLANPQGVHYLREVAGLSVGEQIVAIASRPIADIFKQAPEQIFAFAHHKAHFELRAQAVDPDNPDSDWALLLQDVTEEEQRQRYLRVQERLATVGQMAAGVAHDFNNVMGIIILYAQFVRQKDDLSEKSQEYLKTIEEQGRHAANMISQILDFTRSSTIERGPMNLLSMLKEMIKLLQQILPENIAIHLHTDANEYQILAAPTRLQQALMNMALNARDAMPEGGDFRFSLTSLTLAPDETPPLPDLAPGRWLKVAISDTGDGIQPAHLPRIFDPFFTTKQPGKGTGLGLPQVHGIIKQHEGSITVASALGLGTTFTIYFPLLDRLSDQSRLSEAHSAKPPGGNETILLVEDNVQLRASLRETLADLGYTILEAENGLAALEILNDGRTNIHLIISDLVMPEMSGLGLYHATEMRRRNGLKILLMSGYPLEESQEELNQIGWLSKPFDAHQIAQKVRALLQDEVTANALRPAS